jgi:hypothetical protein
MVEVGLQSAKDNTLALIKRGHDAGCFADAILRLKNVNIFTLAHIILGLPGETMEDWIATGKFLAELEVDAVKIHPLHIVKDTELARWYEKGDYVPLTLEGYVEGVVRVLQVLSPDCLIARLTGEAPPEFLLAPQWCREKWKVLDAIRGKLEQIDTWQGKIYKRI